MDWRRLHVDVRPLRRRDFRNLWVGQMVSTIGAEIAVVAVPFQVYALTHSTALVGLLGLASLVPLLVVPLVGGAFADALDRRSVVLVTETGLALVALLFLEVLHALSSRATRSGLWLALFAPLRALSVLAIVALLLDRLVEGLALWMSSALRV